MQKTIFICWSYRLYSPGSYDNFREALSQERQGFPMLAEAHQIGSRRLPGEGRTSVIKRPAGRLITLVLPSLDRGGAD